MSITVNNTDNNDKTNTTASNGTAASTSTTTASTTTYAPNHHWVPRIRPSAMPHNEGWPHMCAPSFCFCRVKITAENLSAYEAYSGYTLNVRDNEYTQPAQLTGTIFDVEANK